MAWTNNEASTSTAGSAARISGGVGTTVTAASSITVSDFITPISGTATINTISGPVSGEIFILDSIDGFTLGTTGNITGITSDLVIPAGRVAVLSMRGTTVKVSVSMVPSDAILRSGGSQALSADLNVGNCAITSGNSLGVVNVRASATGGAGTSGDPWTGWDTAITWAARTRYHFPKGYYSYATAPNWGLTGIEITGEGRATNLVCTGASNIVTVDGGAAGGGVFNVRISDMTLWGNAAALSGLYVRSAHHSSFENIRIFNCTVAAVETHWLVGTHFQNVSLTALGEAGSFTTIPATGFLIDKRGASETTNECTFTNCEADYVNPGVGFDLAAAGGCVFINGTAQLNECGIRIQSGSSRNTFIGTDVEFTGTAKSVTALTSNGAGTATATVTGHGYSTGDAITITGAAQTEYNVTALITVTDPNTFTYTISGAPVTPATGTITATSGRSIEVSGAYNNFHGALGSQVLRIKAGAVGNTVVSGQMSSIVIEATAARNALFHTVLLATGLYSDLGTNTVVVACRYASGTLLAADQLAYGKLKAPGAIFTAAAPTVAAAQVGLGSTTATTVGAPGGASALPATPTGYWIVNIAGTDYKIPYYAT